MMYIQLPSKNFLSYMAHVTCIAVAMAGLASLTRPIWAIIIYCRQNLRLGKTGAATILSTKLFNLVSCTLKNCSAYLTNTLHRIIARMIRAAPPSNFAFHTTKNMLMNFLRSISRKRLTALLACKLSFPLLAREGMLLAVYMPTFLRAKSVLSRSSCVYWVKGFSTLFASGRNYMICLLAISRAKKQITQDFIAWPAVKSLTALRADMHHLFI